MGLLDQIYNVVDSLSTLESMPAVIDTAKVDTSNILNEVPLGTQTGGSEDITDLPPSPTLGIQTRGEMYKAGSELLSDIYGAELVQSEESIKDIDRISRSLEKISSYGFDVSGKRQDIDRAKEAAIKSLKNIQTSERMAKVSLESKLFGPAGSKAYIPGKSMSAEDLSALAIEMGVEPNLLSEMLKQLPLQRKPSGWPGMESRILYPRR